MDPGSSKLLPFDLWPVRAVAARFVALLEPPPGLGTAKTGPAGAAARASPCVCHSRGVHGRRSACALPGGAATMDLPRLGEGDPRRHGSTIQREKELVDGGRESRLGEERERETVGRE